MLSQEFMIWGRERIYHILGFELTGSFRFLYILFFVWVEINNESNSSVLAKKQKQRYQSQASELDAKIKWEL